MYTNNLKIVCTKQKSSSFINRDTTKRCNDQWQMNEIKREKKTALRFHIHNRANKKVGLKFTSRLHKSKWRAQRQLIFFSFIFQELHKP